MLTQLRLKNWRSLRAATIDFTPITVLVGANSSGKSNIFDAFSFLRSLVSDKDTTRPIFLRGGRENLLTVGANENDPIEIECTFNPKPNEVGQLTYKISLEHSEKGTKFVEKLVDTDPTQYKWIDGVDGRGKMRNADLPLEAESSYYYLLLPAFGRRGDVPKEIQLAYRFFSERWQLLGENFLPPFRMNLLDNFTYLPSPDLLIIDAIASNMVFLLENMHNKAPKVYQALQDDLKWLLTHVQGLEVARDDREVNLSIRETGHQNRIAPTISAGTKRIVAMLAAYHVLDAYSPDHSGLVFIEEPDTAIHPLLLRNFVELLRQYTSDPAHPRQFILTTHNPMMLNLFKPEEVRIVERNEQGETRVQPVDKEIAQVWYDKYGDYHLGDIWTTRLLGGVPK